MPKLVVLAVTMTAMGLTAIAPAVEVLQPGYVVEPYASYTCSVSVASIGLPYGMAFASDGNLYLSQWHNYPDAGSLYRISANGHVVEWLTGFGTPRRMVWAGGSEFGDYLYVTDGTSDTLYRVGLDGTVPAFAGVFGGLHSLGLDQTGVYGGSLYVATRGTDQMHAVTPSGQVHFFSSFPNAVPSGHVDLTFDPGTDYRRRMYVALDRPAGQLDGQILVGGNFSSVNGLPAEAIARLHSEIHPEPPILCGGPHSTTRFAGQSETFSTSAVGAPPLRYQWWFEGNPLSGATNATYTLDQVQPVNAGHYVVTVSNAFGGVASPAATLTVLQMPTGPGAVDVTFDPTASGRCVGVAGQGASINAIAPEPDGKILVGGADRVAGGDSWLFRLESPGFRDVSFVPGARPEVPGVQTIVLQPDGKILVGGNLGPVGELSSDGIVRLNPEGSVDSSFVPPPLWIGDESILGIAVQPDGKILIAGDFGLEVDGIILSGLARLNGDGRVDLSFRPDRWMIYGPARALLVQPDGTIVVGGRMLRTNGQSGNLVSLVRVNSDGSLHSVIELFPGLDSEVRALATGPAGTIYAGGIYFSNRPHVAFVLQLDDAGRIEPRFCPQFEDMSGEESIESLAVQSDGQLLVGGNFASVNGLPAHDLVRLNGGATRPNLTTELASQSRFTGQSATFTIMASGTPPLSYQWLFNGNAIAGATNTTFSLSHVEAASAGHYSVRVANAAGTVTSAEATLTVLPAPTGPGSVDTTFDPTAGGELLGLADQWAGNPWDRAVSSVVVEPDGNFVIAGAFVGINGWPRNNVARLHPDGSVDVSFDSSWGTDGEVNWITRQPDGKLILAGWFSSVQGVPREGIARLNPDGTLDTDFAPVLQGGNPGIVVWHTVVQPDGRILIAGAFDSVNGESRCRLARLNADGTLDSSFDASPTLTGEYVGVGRIYLLPDGRLLIKGDFERWNQHLLRLHPGGGLDTSFDLPASGYSLYGVAVQSDGKVVIGASWPSDHRISRVNADGSYDATFHPVNLGLGDAYQVEVQADGGIVIAGPFSTVNGIPRQGFARLNSDGSLDTGFDPASALTQAHAVSFGLLPDDRILLLAEDNVLADSIGYFFCVGANGTLESEFSTEFAGPGSQVNSILPLPDGKTLIGGTFVSLNGICRSSIARLNTDGTLDPSFIPALPTHGRFGLCAVQPDGKALVNGWVGNPDESYGAVIARLHTDGTLDTSFGGGFIDVYWVTAMTVQPDGKILIGGSFTSVQGVARQYLARLNPDGTVDLSFTPPPLYVGEDHHVQTLAVQRDGQILVGGELGVGVVRLHPDGRLDQEFLQRVSAGETVFHILIQPDDKILLSTGCTVDGTSWPGPARLNADGSLDQSFRASVGYAWRLALAPDGKVLVVQDNALVRLHPDGSTDASFEVEIGPKHWAGMISAVAVQPDGNVLIGGDFRSVNGVPRHGIARLTNELQPLCHPADRTPADWRLTALEVDAYAAAWCSGGLWPLPPNPIPIDYLTRAGALWRGGECYAWDFSVTVPPLWWVYCRSNPITPATTGQTFDGGASHAQDDGVETQFVHGYPHPVVISVKPATNVKAWAVEDQPPPGWSVSDLSDGGLYDAVNRKVKWGPFYDDFPRSLKYKAWPPTHAPRDVVFVGRASFDGLGVDIVGPRHRRNGARLTGAAALGQGEFRLTLSSEPGTRCVIERSADLTAWIPWIEVTNTAGRLELTDSASPNDRHRYYRARLVEEMGL